MASLETNLLEAIVFQEYCRQMEVVLAAQAKAAGIFDHPDNIGRARECFVNDFLKNNLPPTFKIWTGEIIDHTVTPANQKRRRQVDLAVTRSDVPVLSLGDSALMPCEAVLATIEVKSQLNKQHFFNALTAIQAWREMERLPFTGLQKKYTPERIMNFIFAFQGPTVETLYKHMVKYSAKHNVPFDGLFDICIILGHSTIAANNGLVLSNPHADPHDHPYIFVEQRQDNLFLFLHALFFYAGQFSTPPNLTGYFVGRSLNYERNGRLPMPRVG
jgi:hypothetical protein